MAMVITEATDSDIPEIIALLKISLGESLMPKSEGYWRWKHIENPFGRSPVLLCWEGSKLIGVRAFMRWEWIDDGKLYKAVRAVDTATHPEYQGKGIFKKLTLSLVNSCSQSGDHFVFNTPNAQSKPGYLKMGWAEAGRLSIKVNVNKPIRLLKNIISKSRLDTSDNSESSSIKDYLQKTELSPLLEKHCHRTKGIITNVSASYLKWRYVDVPVARYIVIGEKRDDDLLGLIIGRVKQTRIGRELRITDIFLKEKKAGEILIQQFKECTKMLNIDYCTLSGAIPDYSKQLFGSLSLGGTVGPTVTVRNLSMHDLSPLKNFKNWCPSLGDLELF